MLSGWRVGRIGGVEIRLDPSLLLIALLITVNLWQEFSDRFPFMTVPTALAFSASTAVLFFLSILVHELAHAGMSKARNIPVLGITLWMFGGATHAKVEAKGPADEFLVTVVGPLSSGALGGLFLLIHAGSGSLGRPAVFMFGYLAVINLILAVFNLLPGFPLDGGRLLRSGVWKLTGSLDRATRVAARVGQVVALLIVVAGIAEAARSGQFEDALWPALIGWFLFRGATESLADETRRRRLRGLTARAVMSPPPPSLSADLPAGRAVETYLFGHEGEAFPVVEDGRVAGFVSVETARSIDPDRPVREALIGLQGTVQAGPDEAMDRVIERLIEERAERVLVVEGDRVVGMIEHGDLARILSRGAGDGRS